MRFISFLAIIFFCSNVFINGQNLVLDTHDVYPRSTPDGKGFEDLILKEAFNRVGYTISIEVLPAERVFINVNQGIDDGLFVRIAGLEKIYPNLIMIPEPVCDYKFAAFTMNPAIKLNGWESFKPWNIAFIRGWKIYETNITEAKSILKVKNEDALFEVLIKGRVDLIVYEMLNGQVRIRDRKHKNIIAINPLLAKRDMYCYLNKRHAGIVGEVAKALREMKRDGTYQKIVNSVIGNL